jgi:hypothetical protein
VSALLGVAIEMATSIELYRILTRASAWLAHEVVFGIILSGPAGEGNGACQEMELTDPNSISARVLGSSFRVLGKVRVLG